MARFIELKALPETFKKYNKCELERQARADFDECYQTIKANVMDYIANVNNVLTKVLERKVTSTDSYLFMAIYNQFDRIVRQFIQMDARYRDYDIPQQSMREFYTKMVDLADEAALGIYEGGKTRNHPDVVEDMAAMMLESDAEIDLEDFRQSVDEMESCAQNINKENAKAQPKVANHETENSRYAFVTSNTTFKDVAGLHEVKEDLAQYVDMLKRPEVYKAYGAKLPKGTIFYGPPGTGKTLLSRALAGEAQVKFIATAATDFTSSKWGETPQKIKELFTTARENAPCIVFIDEIDMLGMNRGLDSANSLAHREHLNALLTEMDGFDQYEGVMVIAATNRLEDLDPALIRPGRFDNQFAIPLPCNVDEVEEVVQIYMKKKQFSEDVQTRALAHKLLGNSPADIEGLLNEACLLAIRKNNGVIRMSDIDEAYVKKAVKGHVRSYQDASPEEQKIVAYHEAGHALIAVLSNRRLQSVSILGTTTGAGGLTVSEPLNKHLLRKSDFEKQIRISYGGRAAEEVVFGEDMITTGASADIKKCTSLISEAASNYGFDLLNSDNPVPKIKYTDAKKIDSTIEKASIKYYGETVEMIKENVEVLHLIAKELLDNGTISGRRVLDIYEIHNAPDLEFD